MRNLNFTALRGNDFDSVSGNAIDSSELVSASFTVRFGDNTAEGTFKLQASNDICHSGYMTAIDGFTPTNWVDIPAKTAAILAGASAILTVPQIAYRWTRPVWVNTATGSQYITTIGAGYGVTQAVTAICIADVSGSLNNKYFLLYSAHDAGSYYVWFNVNGAGVNPAVPGKIGIQVAIATNSADTVVADAAAAAISAVGAGLVFNAITSTEELIIFNLVEGPATAPSDGPGGSGTGFTIDLARPGVDPSAIQLGNRYFFVNAADADGGDEYAFWFNVDGGGVEPIVPGKIMIPVDIFSTDDANGVANGIVISLQTLPAKFANAVNIGPSITLTWDNVSAGPFTPASDFNTTFTFGVLAGGSSTVTVDTDAVGI